MTPTEKHQRVAELIESALELDPAGWPALLENACHGNADLRREVESLLHYKERARELIEAPAFQTNAEAFLAADQIEEGATLKAGELLGDYKILLLIGEGGMGEVYLAEDVALGRKVAIKLVKKGLDTRSIIGRFRHEERILAGLNHPCIARLYGAAVTPEGSSYFVMEYIEGERLDEYCHRRALSIKDRLELFRKVCSAVAYAHQRLVIHRDIKPVNIRVTPEGEPKLLDFGIAKLLSPETNATGEETISLREVMTPDYASPEQIRGESMTTTSDIYSLGVVLYELLTGRKPFRMPPGRQADMAGCATTEQPAQRPSTAVMQDKGRWPVGLPDPKLLRGDLDNIVLMAIRQEPSRRYSSVGQFSEDIRRHLVGRPVIARKDTWSYRGSKFIKRNKVAVIAAAFVMLSLVAGIVATTWQAQVAKAERAKAERRFNDVRKLANSYLFELHDAIEKLPGSTPARELLVKRALEYLDSLARESRDDPSLQRELVSAYLKVGNVQGNPNNANLGDTAGALISYRKALTLAKRLTPSAGASDASSERLLAVVHEKMADVLAAMSNIPAAVRSSGNSLAIFKSIADAQPTNAKARRSLAISYVKAGDVLGNPNFPNSGDAAGAMRNYRSSLAIWQALSRSDPTDTTGRRFLGLVHERIGTMLEGEENMSDALENYRKSLVIRDALAADYPADSDAVRDVAIVHEKIANVLVAKADLAAALTSRQKSLGILKRLASADPQNMQARQSLAISYVHLGDLLGYPDSPNLQRAAEAREAYQLAFASLPSIKEVQPGESKTREILGLIHERAGAMMALDGKVAEALNEYREALRIEEKLGPGAVAPQDMAELYAKFGQIHVALASNPAATVSQRRNSWREANTWYERSLTAWQNLRNRGRVTKTDADKIERLQTEIKKCAAEMANL